MCLVNIDMEALVSLYSIFNLQRRGVAKLRGPKYKFTTPEEKSDMYKTDMYKTMYKNMCKDIILLINTVINV